jgi:hypothetical protein
MVKEKDSCTSPAPPTRSTSNPWMSMASSTFISSSARARPGQMRGPEPKGMWAPASWTAGGSLLLDDAY